MVRSLKWLVGNEEMEQKIQAVMLLWVIYGATDTKIHASIPCKQAARSGL